MNMRKLKGKIAEAGLTQRELAKRIGVSENTLARKIKGIRDFTIGEANRICEELEIKDPIQKADIFLTL